MATKIERVPSEAARVAESEWTENALTVLERRYLKRDPEGRVVESPAEMVRRVAHALAAPDSQYGDDPAATEARFFDLIGRLVLLPNSPTLMNAGRESGQLAACFVLPVEDSLSGIFDAVKWAAMIQQTGGGTGFSFSRLRPAGDPVLTTQGAASGPISFIEVFNAATDAIRQGGVRRGANMGILRVDHPDVIEFASVKSDPARLRNFNISVALTDEFVRAVEEGLDYALVNPRTGKAVRRLDARKVFDLIARLAWHSGEPGVIFIDRINAENPTPQCGPMESTNPCGELPLLPFEACNLASIDVGKLCDGDEGRCDFDWERLGEAVDAGIHLLDNVVDANRYPLPAIERITRANRKIGLGVMGFADALIRLGVPYDSDPALEVASRLMRFIEERSRAASARLAERRGAFPNFASSRWDRPGAPPLRNATTTTIAPTGTISIIAGCSGGIEPLYAVSFVRRVLDGARLCEVHPLFVARARREGWYSEALMERIAERGSVRGMEGVPADAQALFATAHDVAPIRHLRMQAAFQRHVHNSVSKTINLPHDAAPEDVAAIYREAFRLGLKGVTVYRDGSRREQVLSFGATDAAGRSDGRGVVPTPCPGCGAVIPTAHQGACTICVQCGYSRCA
ncbi:MAG: adenosylcobalamin-dependent ribonucleoside-diphosphate reductase [Myxococcales bacterium]|nr:adenosylcobalamin-dependent ribonucleoside-diphosphate reductase [Myxococcales bacterium]